MYRLSQTQDLSFFVGTELDEVRFGTNDVILHFHPDVRLTILSDFAVAGPRGPLTRFSDFVLGSRALLELLTAAVSSARPTPEGDLRLEFASGAILMVFDDSDQYESFWIQGGGREIIV